MGGSIVGLRDEDLQINIYNNLLIVINTCDISAALGFIILTVQILHLIKYK